MPIKHDGFLTPQITTEMLVAAWLALFERKHPTGDAIASAPTITFSDREEQLYRDLTEELSRRTNADRERLKSYSPPPIEKEPSLPEPSGWRSALKENQKRFSKNLSLPGPVEPGKLREMLTLEETFFIEEKPLRTFAGERFFAVVVRLELGPTNFVGWKSLENARSSLVAICDEKSIEESLNEAWSFITSKS